MLGSDKFSGKGKPPEPHTCPPSTCLTFLTTRVARSVKAVVVETTRRRPRRSEVCLARIQALVPTARFQIPIASDKFFAKSIHPEPHTCPPSTCLTFLTARVARSVKAVVVETTRVRLRKSEVWHEKNQFSRGAHCAHHIDLLVTTSPRTVHSLNPTLGTSHHA